MEGKISDVIRGLVRAPREVTAKWITRRRRPGSPPRDIVRGWRGEQDGGAFQVGVGACHDSVGQDSSPGDSLRRKINRFAKVRPGRIENWA